MRNFYLLKPIFSFFIVLSVTYTIGCDKTCTTTVNDFATIENQTGRKLIISVCKGKFYGQQDLSINATQKGAFELGSREQNYTTSGTGANSQCDKEPGSTYDMGISLTTQSFNEVKFCFLNATKGGSNVIIIEKSHSCPADTKEQLLPLDNCDSKLVQQ